MKTKVRFYVLGFLATLVGLQFLRKNEYISTQNNSFLWNEKEFNGNSKVFRSLRPPPLRKEPLEKITDFYDYIENPSVKCHCQKKFEGDDFVAVKEGNKYENVIDGDYDMCLDPFLNILPDRCNVYSFGINDMWTFEESISEFGCRVFAFDPTMNQRDFNRSEMISFYNVGVGAIDGNGKCFQNLAKNENCQVRRLSTIMTTLGHNGPDFRLDYMKLDVEGAEFDFLQEALENNEDLILRVKQIGMEIHPGIYNGDLKPFQAYYKIFQQLEALGFRIFSSQVIPFFDFDLTAVPGYQTKPCYTLIWAKWPTKTLYLVDDN